MKQIREHDIEAYLISQVARLGGETRKVKWIGRNSAPDRVVMLPRRLNQCEDPRPATLPAATLWFEVKRPDTILTFPADARERAQQREHERMRALGQRVFVVGTYDEVDEALR